MACCPAAFRLARSITASLLIRAALFLRLAWQDDGVSWRSSITSSAMSATIYFRISIMKKRFALFMATLGALLAACTPTRSPGPRSDTLGQPAIPLAGTTLEAYKEVLAQHISNANAHQVYGGQPQAFLRSVIVLKFSLDASGKLLQSDIIRSNHDSVTEAAALTSLRSSAPFPRPALHLLKQGRLELSETWLFNADGRFQIRSIAQPQMSQ
jgi:protein TonB